jgi:hypothetical protein
MKKFLALVTLWPMFVCGAEHEYKVLKSVPNFELEQKEFETCNYSERHTGGRHKKTDTTVRQGSCADLQVNTIWPAEGYRIFVKRLEDGRRQDFVWDTPFERGTIIKLNDINE